MTNRIDVITIELYSPIKIDFFFCFPRSEEGAVTIETSVKVETSVKAEASVKVETSVKVEASVKAESSGEEEPGVLNIPDNLEDSTGAVLTR